MSLLVDTQLLLWSRADSRRISPGVASILLDPINDLYFSAASIWELTIKSALGRPNFDIAPHILRDDLLQNGYTELSVSSTHALAVARLPLLHKDPFDRLLAAQALVENFTLLTADRMLARYPVPIQLV